MEGKYIRELGTLNKQIPGRTLQEYRKAYNEQNKDKITEYKKAYHKQNKDKLPEYKKVYREQNKEQISKYHKAYGLQYREMHKEAISKSKNRICACECGLTYANANKGQHCKSKRHQRRIQELQQQQEQDTQQ